MAVSPPHNLDITILVILRKDSCQARSSGAESGCTDLYGKSALASGHRDDGIDVLLEPAETVLEAAVLRVET